MNVIGSVARVVVKVVADDRTDTLLPCKLLQWHQSTPFRLTFIEIFLIYQNDRELLTALPPSMTIPNFPSY